MTDDLAPQPIQALPPGYPADWVETVTLKDGQPITIRPIRPDDASRLQAAFRRLSAQSVYLRFLESFKELTDQQAWRFANLDYQNHMALVAEIVENETPAVIGVARYAMIGPHEPGLAESAIVVVDDFQKRGLGTLLLDRLTRYARTHGVDAFLATVHQTNAPILRFINSSNFPTRKKIIEPGVWEIRIRLERRMMPR